MQELLTMLDTKYKRLEYLESSGTQYIDTGIVPTANTRVVTEIKCTTEGNDYTVFGCVNTQSPTVTNYNYYSVIKAYNKWYLGLNNEQINLGTFNTNVDYKIDFNNNGVVYINDTVLVSDISPIGNGNLYISYRRGYSESRSGYFRYKYFQIYDNGTLVRNFVPVLRKTDNEIGMLDLVEGKFYPNAGTGKFTANLDTMYAIIQGTPTQSPYGVFSGFSASNYLQLQQNIDFNTNFNITIKFRYSATTSGIQAIFSWSAKLYIYIASNGKLYARTQHNNSWDITIVTSTALSVDTDYVLSFIKNGDNYSLILNGTEIGTQTSSNTIDTSSYNATIGRTYSGSDFFSNGSIDLNRSYIKVDDTKYKLQAVVGYNKVGTLTESPSGVFSGFSSANYLEITQPLNLSLTSIHRRYIRFKTPSTYAGSFKHYPITSVSVNNSYRIVDEVYESNNLFHCTVRAWDNNDTYNIGSFYNITLSSDTWYRIEIIGNNGIWIGKLYDDNNNLLYQYTKTNLNFNSSSTQLFYLGYCGTSNLPINSIDLNKTYIKINNKLWFNGLEA